MIVASYTFVTIGAWNDRILGLAPTPLTRALELILALALALEIIARATLTSRRGNAFWIVLGLDALSVLTVIPWLVGASLLRLGRLLYAVVRLVHLLDRLALKRRNSLYLIVLYPVVVPLVAAVVYALESRTAHSTIRNYFEALAVCFQFALSLGNVRPENPWAMALCGMLFIAGIVCIGVATNAVSARYDASKRGR